MPYKSQQLTSCVASGTTETREQCQGVTLSAEDPDKADLNLDFAFVENAHVFLLFPKLEKHGPLCAIQCSIFIPFIPLFQVGGPQHGNLIASAFTLLRSGHLLDFLSFLFCRKSLICLKGKAMSPRWGNTVLCSSSLQLPRLCLRPLKGLLS